MQTESVLQDFADELERKIAELLDDKARLQNNLGVANRQRRALQGEVDALKRTVDEMSEKHREEIAKKDRAIDNYHKSWVDARREAESYKDTPTG